VRLVAETAGLAVLEFVHPGLTRQRKRSEPAAFVQSRTDEWRVACEDGSAKRLLISGRIQHDDEIIRLNLRGLLDDIHARFAQVAGQFFSPRGLF
jgi:hypothetical protein